ncbi:sulfotransferase family protein [Rubrivivax albus]|nr:sulfotransferase [Rubrivivax albus]MCB1997561.1 sulfotransferase [Rhodoferax sp.]
MTRKHILVCGMSRAGTTLLHSLLMNTLPGFDFFDREVPALAHVTHPRNLVTKRPLDCLQLDQIEPRFAGVDLRIVFCVRDPRAVICSTHPEVPHDYFIGYRHQYFIVPAQGICEPSNPGLRQIHAAWRAVRGRAYTLHYENLVQDPDGTQAGLFDFLGEPVSQRFSSFDETSPVAAGMAVALNGQRPIDVDSLESWTRHPLRIWNEFTENTGLFEMVRELGYEHDNDWFTRRYARRLAA